MKRVFLGIFLVALAVVVLPASASGSLIAYEGFEYTAGNSLVGQDQGSGWSTAWSAETSITNTNTIIQEAGLTSTTGNYLRDWGGASDNCSAYRALDTTLTGTIYMSFFAQSNNGAIRGFGVSLAYYDEDAAAFSLPSDNILASTNATDVFSMSTNSGASKAPTGVSYEALKLVVICANVDNGHFDMYLLDPDGDYPDVVPTSPNSSITTDFDLGTVNAIRLYAGKYDSSRGTADWNMDELRIGTSWEDVVVSVPEPSTLALLACGLLGLLAYAWKKRK